MKHDKLVEWFKSTQIPVSRRRLYMTMLGVCGTPADLPMLEEMIRSKDRQTKGALDALVAAYLTLKGPDGMPLVEELFLKNKDAEYTDTYATIMALRIPSAPRKSDSSRAVAGGFADDARPAATGRPGDSRPGPLGRLVGDGSPGRAVQERRRRIELGPRAGDQLPAGLPVAESQGGARRAGQARSGER